jgi:hypothetical protein
LLPVEDRVLLPVRDGVLLRVGGGVLLRAGVVLLPVGDGVLLPVGVRLRVSQVGPKCAISSTSEVHPLSVKLALVPENNAESKNEFTNVRTPDPERPTSAETVLFEITP